MLKEHDYPIKGLYIVCASTFESLDGVTVDITGFLAWSTQVILLNEWINYWSISVIECDCVYSSK